MPPHGAKKDLGFMKMDVGGVTPRSAHGLRAAAGGLSGVGAGWVAPRPSQEGKRGWFGVAAMLSQPKVSLCPNSCTQVVLRRGHATAVPGAHRRPGGHR